MDKKQIEVKKQQPADNAPGIFKMQSLNLFPEFDRMINRFFGSRFQPLMSEWPTIPSHSLGEIHETDESYVLTAEIPGIPRDAVKIELSGNMLSIRAEYQEESGKETSSRGYRKRYQNFRQSLALPSNVDTANIQAHYEDGMLEVVLPKTANAKTQSIEVQSGRSPATGKKEASTKKH